jgi:type II secretory pathway component PulK
VDSIIVVLIVAVVAVVVWGLSETWRQNWRWKRHRDRQNRGGADGE